MLNLTYTLDPKPDVQIGLIVLQADETIEQDMRRLIPPEVNLLVSRVPSATHVTLDTLAAMESTLGQAAALFPGAAPMAAVGFGCTSGTAKIGADRVAAAIQGSIVTAHVTEPVSALTAAARHLGLRRLGLLSPYIASVSDQLCDVLADAGITVGAFASFNESVEAKVARIAPASIKAAAVAFAAQTEVDGLFLSCTNLKTLDVIAEIEAETGRPVLTSNQVLAWDLLRLAGVVSPRSDVGKLWI